MKRSTLIATGSLAALLGACASVPQQAVPSARVQSYMSHAGAPVDGFNLFGYGHSWNALSDNKLVVSTGVNDAYLLSVDESCWNLEFAHRIGITTSVGNRVQSGFDYIRFDDGFQGQRCRITEIRPVDRAGVRQDLKDLG